MYGLDWFVFCSFATLKLTTDLLVWLNPIPSNRRSDTVPTVIFPLTKCVYLTFGSTLYIMPDVRFSLSCSVALKGLPMISPNFIVTNCYVYLLLLLGTKLNY